MRIKFYCSTKKFEGKHEAHAIASKLEGAAFLCTTRLSDEDQDDPDKGKAALKVFDKEEVDHEKAADELRRLDFVGAIDEEMSERLKTNPKHRQLDLTKLAEELERLELIYHPTTPQLNNIR